MKTNIKRAPIHTHEGAIAQHINAEQQLRRSVMACMLWEDEFYESGETIAKRIAETIALVDPVKVSDIAIEARSKMKLRHVPLLIAREMARLPAHKGLVSNLLPQIIQRADELTEFLAIYWKDGRQKLSAQVKKGLAAAFVKFDEYNLAKYNRDGAVKLRDVLFLSHAKPKSGVVGYLKAQRKSGQPRPHDSGSQLFGRVVDNKLETPDTWEVTLSGGADKKGAFTRLMAEKKLFALAFIRNLRNMAESGVDKAAVTAYAQELNVERVLPFRFITAARFVPQWEDILEPLMFKCLGIQEKLPGHTVLLVDVSGSMRDKVSGKSQASRMDAGFGLGVLLREICDSITILTFSNQVVQVAPRRGFALRDAMNVSQAHNGTYLAQAIQTVNAKIKYDRIIVITDEQTADGIVAPQAKGYVINVDSTRNGVGYGAWTHIDGWSEAVIDYIKEFESISEK